MQFAGEKKLKENMGMTHRSEVVKLSDHVYFLNYFGTSNATLLVGESSCILVDAFETDYYAEDAKKEIAKITDKPVKINDEVRFEVSPMFVDSNISRDYI